MEEEGVLKKISLLQEGDEDEFLEDIDNLDLDG